MSSLFCCSFSTSSFASFIFSFMRSAVSLDLRAISLLAAVKEIFQVLLYISLSLSLTLLVKVYINATLIARDQSYLISLKLTQFILEAFYFLHSFLVLILDRQFSFF